MLLVEVLSNDQGSVREDAKYSAGSTSPPPHTLPRKATQAKTVPRPYTPDGREQRNGHQAEGQAVAVHPLVLVRASAWRKTWKNEVLPLQHISLQPPCVKSGKATARR